MFYELTTRVLFWPLFRACNFWAPQVSGIRQAFMHNREGFSSFRSSFYFLYFFMWVSFCLSWFPFPRRDCRWSRNSLWRWSLFPGGQDSREVSLLVLTLIKLFQPFAKCTHFCICFILFADIPLSLPKCDSWLPSTTQTLTTLGVFVTMLSNSHQRLSSEV